MLVYINGELDPNIVLFEDNALVNDYDNSVWHLSDVLGGSGRVGGKLDNMRYGQKHYHQTRLIYTWIHHQTVMNTEFDGIMVI